jgi:5-methylcytosine-specific restriction endonuclease McrA
MGRALLLNASFEPLCVVSVRRAVVLVLKEKAEIVHRNGIEFRSERRSVPAPSVIRLTHYVRVPYRTTVPLSRRAVFARDHHRCQYCGRGAENLDHVVPRSRGGTHSWDNVVASCRSCNTKKEDRLLAETDLVLRRQPITPHATVWLLAAVGHVDPSWEQYLDIGNGLRGRGRHAELVAGA